MRANRTPLWRLVLFTACVLAGYTLPAPADDWPQWMGPRRDGVWRETGILDKFPKDGPKVLWRANIGGGFSGPAVAEGRVYVMDRQGEQLPKGKEYAGKAGLKGKERVVCLDAATGKPVWTHEYDCHYRVLYTSGPRNTPTVEGGRVYTVGAMGDVLCLDAAKGTVFWHKRLTELCKTDPPLWGYSASPLYDQGRLICLAGGEGSAVVALDKDTGNVLWRALTVKEVGYAPPMIFDAGGKRQLIVWHTEAINSLDPATGKVYWSVKFPDGEPKRPAITVATPRKEGDLLFVSCVHHGSLVLKLASDKPGAELVYKGKSDDVSKPDGLHAVMGSPILQHGHIYGICAFGELRCLEATTGKRLWEHKTVERTNAEGKTVPIKALFATTFIVPHGDRFFLFNDQGDLIIAQLTPAGYKEVDRAHIIDPTLFSRERDVVWSHPAFANRCMIARNDREVVCVSLRSLAPAADRPADGAADGAVQPGNY
jgi:outer membrane protein assembly factor BamB